HPRDALNFDCFVLGGVRTVMFGGREDPSAAQMAFGERGSAQDDKPLRWRSRCGTSIRSVSSLSLLNPS
ncbi:MAG: hypothetical protein V2A73_09535, partial [Pseudomonadota bacterium]